jgi:5-methylcytosine-specific restriction endonuclease McrA
MTYAEYLETPHWRETRAAALARAGGRCQVCNSRESLEVHHNTYENLGQEEPEDLCVLCDECHELYSERLPAASARSASNADLSEASRV